MPTINNKYTTKEKQEMKKICLFGLLLCAMISVAYGLRTISSNQEADSVFTENIEALSDDEAVKGYAFVYYPSDDNTWCNCAGKGTEICCDDRKK